MYEKSERRLCTINDIKHDLADLYYLLSFLKKSLNRLELSYW